MKAGPFAKLLKTISDLQKEFPQDQVPIRTALVTSRSAPAHERVIRTLRAWEVRIDEAFFLGGVSKKEVLEAFRSAGFCQVILSASKRDNLLGQAARFDILHCFDTVLGLDHISATSKEGIGREWMNTSGIIPDDCVMIGDTLHDADVARAMGCHCILVCGGHQLPETLKMAGVPVAETLRDAAKQIFEKWPE